MRSVQGPVPGTVNRPPSGVLLLAVPAIEEVRSARKVKGKESRVRAVPPRVHLQIQEEVLLRRLSVAESKRDDSGLHFVRARVHQTDSEEQVLFAEMQKSIP